MSIPPCYFFIFYLFENKTKPNDVKKFESVGNLQLPLNHANKGKVEHSEILLGF